jgi:ParB/Sulfiredoxin domain
MHIETLPLSKLVPSPTNVRKAKSDITGLAANIMARGLLQNLQVCLNGETYEVVAGGRRLAALKLLAKQKKIAADYGVACEVCEGADAVESGQPARVARCGPSGALISQKIDTTDEPRNGISGVTSPLAAISAKGLNLFGAHDANATGSISAASLLRTLPTRTLTG